MNHISEVPVELECVHARGVLFRLAAALFDYPLAETQQAIESGRVAHLMEQALATLGEPTCPLLAASASQTDLEVGYMATFIHGRRGKPRVPLVASAYPILLKGEAQASYLLNVQTFYKHFGLKAATEDEGMLDEPDHLVAMLEFCALLCHLETQALNNRRDPSHCRRALRDFLTRYLIPLLNALRSRYHSEPEQGLDATLAHLIEVLPELAEHQRDALEEQVGPCPQPGSQRIPMTNLPQGLWD
ncbi:molecular chaperone TorD family protein [Marinobacterium weihaiense]|uniref:Molecular chaperone TorD family protein n=1 Tax=Marinobacterium weihaiense TaxID=2851016 RepID=A0ABS6MDZ4_9GAMM|nr:molecular chaperone TorD family protein [Marinobacterium weihaiense]MBV0934521.1 molecular chaperone TorD family protein [Marinobacterium weihaiense]